MKKFIMDNKLISTVVAFLFTCLITYTILFNTWVTNQIFGHKETITSHIAVQAVEQKILSDQVKGVGEELSNFKKDVKVEFEKTREKIDGNQEKIINILMRVEKNSKSIEKKMYDK